MQPYTSENMRQGQTCTCPIISSLNRYAATCIRLRPEPAGLQLPARLLHVNETTQSHVGSHGMAEEMHLLARRLSELFYFTICARH